MSEPIGTNSIAKLLDDLAVAQDQLVTAQIALSQEVSRLAPGMAFDAADYASMADADDILLAIEEHRASERGSLHYIASFPLIAILGVIALIALVVLR